MNFSFLKLVVAVVFASIFSIAVDAQLPDASASSGRDPQRGRETEAKTLQDMLVKQKIARDKKDFEEMLKRGDQALRISEQLETAYAKTSTLSGAETAKLENLEKLVTKIRNELGGDEDLGAETEVKDAPSSISEAIGYLKKTSSRLVDELKKMSRFSISAAAIQTSNNLIRVVRFLRIRK
ncbi:MAG: hypothetical protein LC730_05585 [Acidobacteria bacterium]|nr:hypothetical protein [Acidobacteriota bacterium]MCA1608914.1 hypothetical protein [Acidobacteriota bacterium]